MKHDEQIRLLKQLIHQLDESSVGQAGVGRHGEKSRAEGASSGQVDISDDLGAER